MPLNHALKEIERLKPFEEGYYRLLEILTTHCFDHEDLEACLHSEMYPHKSPQPK